ncbi:hypothetical protein NCH01_17830 [Neoasaia chiangmaiensis]|uniref:Uncharacterized protein n=1 Tax=Neoasaia chiangmaiensis TaxID=320497 RepID=A0A1U9KRN0_9PROT|nr:hypothetical protein [Neoasaia chiangmaiensis]AQS88521.1 hypothetical protein A0U93_11900 [Neoasaia chiangmaiensis]GEN15352.1 hypothetical protein NCH01_17830 [Neoasaia chiangmaiensis]
MKFTRYFGAALLSGTIAATTFTMPPAHAISARECHQKFTAAKKDGTLNGQKYKEFKAAQCGDASTAAVEKNSTPADKAADTSASTKPAASTTTPASPGAGIASRPSTVAAGNVVFPSSVAAQYAKLTPGKARMKTCVDQYNANKTTGGNGNLKWIEKGGGYWSQCNAKLKG